MTRYRAAYLVAWRIGAAIALCIGIGISICISIGISGCDGRFGRGCTRVVSLDAQHAADEYLSQSLRIAAPAKIREKYFAASLHKLRRTALGKSVDWGALSAVERNLAFAGLVGQKRDAADDQLLVALVADGVEPFVLDPLGRAPFAVAAQLDHPALNLLLPLIATDRKSVV